MPWSVRPPWCARRLGPSLVSACWDGRAAEIVVTTGPGRATHRPVNAARDIDLDITGTPQRDESALRAYRSVSAAARRLDAPLIPVEPFEELLAEDPDQRSMRRQRWDAWHGDRPSASLFSCCRILTTPTPHT